MDVLIDTNVILDVLMMRDDHITAGAVLRLSGVGKIRGFVSASAFTDIYYILNRKLRDSAGTAACLNSLLQLIEILDVNSDDIQNALKSGWRDFEDCVQYRVAQRHSVQYFITRNRKDFEESLPLPIEPIEFLKLIQ